MTNCEIKMIAVDCFEKGFMAASNLLAKGMDKAEKQAFLESMTQLLEAELKKESESWDMAFIETANA